MKLTEIIKAKLKGCGKEWTIPIPNNEEYDMDIICGKKNLGKKNLYCPICKANLSGMQTAIKSEFQKWIDMFNRLKEKEKLNEWVEAFISENIEDCKNALKLLEENK